MFWYIYIFLSCFVFPHFFIILSQLQKGVTEGTKVIHQIFNKGIGVWMLASSLGWITCNHLLSVSLSFSIQIKIEW